MFIGYHNQMIYIGYHGHVISCYFVCQVTSHELSPPPLWICVRLKQFYLFCAFTNECLI